MDASLYKDVTTSRGIKYHYYYSPAQGAQPTLLFCHGFPSTSRDWRHIVPYFKERGYGVIAPDMLGYGGTDKPLDPAAYVSSALTKDIIDILDAEKVERVIAVGHDWGTRPVGRLANYYPERVTAYAFLAVPYSAPAPPGLTYEAALEMTKNLAGYELFGYWKFFSEENANDVIQQHIDSFVSILFPQDPSIWKERVAITDGLKNSLLEDFHAPLASYFSEGDKQEFIKTFREGGFQAPTCWYKVQTQNLSHQDDQQIPPERRFPPVTAPIFFGAAALDRVCLAALGIVAFKKEEFKDHKITLTTYDADHWLIFSHADAINKDLEAWIKTFAPQKSNI